MKCLVTTSKSFLVLDIDTGHYEHIDVGNGRYYGIAYSDDEIFLAARGPETKTSITGRIFVYGYGFKLKEKISPSFGLRNMHQIHLHENCLYVTCTWDNMIATWNKEGDKWLKWFPDPKKILKDYDHINSINVDDKLISIIAKKDDVSSELWLYDKDTKKEKHHIILNAIGVHNVAHWNGDVWFLESDKHKLRNNNGLSLFLGEWWLRGLSITDDYIIVGGSPRSDREKRDYATCVVKVLKNKEPFETIKEIYLKNEGNVHEIRAPGYFDYAYRSYLGRKL